MAIFSRLFRANEHADCEASGASMKWHNGRFAALLDRGACIAAALCLACIASPEAPWAPTRTETSAAHMLKELRKIYSKIRGLDRADMTPRFIAGHFTHGGGLSGRELFLFSDSTYIYTEWADISPETVYDKGTWALTDGFVVLSSDKSLEKAPHLPFDHVYLPIRLKGRSGLFIMSHRWDFSYFADHAGNNPASMFEMVALHLTERMGPDGEQKAKARLLQRVWKPNSF